MDKKKLERKLRKKVRKFAEWGKRNGVPYASMFYMLDGHHGNGDFFNTSGELDGGTKVHESGFLGDEDE